MSTVLAVVAPFIPVVIVALLVIVFLMMSIKVVSGNEVLVVTGVGATKKQSVKVKVMRDGVEHEEQQVTYQPKIRIAGASFVWPFIQRATKFDICVEKAEKNADTMKTKTGVEIVIDWGVSFAPNADSVETLHPAIRQFLDKKKDEIRDIIMSVVAGGLRAVISTMEPAQVLIGKETLDESVQKNISAQMAELGYKVQIYIQEVRDADKSTYYHDMAAQDREETHRKAAEIEAKARQAIREKEAEADKIATQAELESKVEIAAKQRDTDVKRAEFKAETDRAQADANIAGELRQTERARELTEKRGAVAVMEQEQADRAAKAEQAVKVTQAETAKKETILHAEAASEQQKIEARAQAEVAKTEAEGRANALKAEAAGQAEAVKTKAEGEAEAVRQQASAEADKVEKIGAAEAKAISAKGKAEAEAIAAKGHAEAEAARALSDAQAANNRVNFEIEKLKIEQQAKIEISTNFARAMASVGEKATFYHLGGSREGDGRGNILTDVLSSIPQLYAVSNAENQALNGEQLPETIKRLVNAIAEPMGSLAEKKTVIRSEDASGADSSSDSDPGVDAGSPTTTSVLQEDIEE